MAPPRSLHRMRRTTRALSVAALALCTACASGGVAEGGFRAPPKSFNGYPSQALADIVFAEARLYTDHADIFKRDLLKRHGIVPVALRVGLRGQGQETARIRIAPDDMDLRLYLQDGTILAPVPYERVAKLDERSSERVTREALKPSLLVTWEDSPQGFVFFQLRDRDHFEIDGTTIVNRNDRLARTLDLSKSLLSFEVATEDRRIPFFVGLQRDRR